MKKTRDKDTIGLLALTLFIFLAGEGIFNWGGYLVPLLWLYSREMVYWLAFVLGLFVTSMSGGRLGLASLILIVSVFVFRHVTRLIPANPWLIWLVAVAVNWVLDKATNSAWGWGEIVASGILVVVLVALGFLREEEIPRLRSE